jgi:phosphatidylserine/phosphatidylglycerophosphate/cardiolipin synthase-like enzyme
MAKYLRTTQVSAEVESLILDAKSTIFIVSPYLKLSDRIKELLYDKNLLRVNIQIIFGKNDLSPTETSFLKELKYVQLFFSKNLHAKCYFNEDKMIITSMNLYEFSQQNNREMGVLLDCADDNDKVVYNAAMDDVRTILRSADEVSFTMIEKKENIIEAPQEIKQPKPQNNTVQDKDLRSKINSSTKFFSTTLLSKEWGIPSKDLFSIFEKKGWVEMRNDERVLTPKGEKIGGQMKKGQYGDYIAWADVMIEEINK